MLLLSLIHAANISTATNDKNSLQQKTKNYEEMTKHIKEYEEDCRKYNLADKKFIEVEKDCYQQCYLCDDYNDDLSFYKDSVTYQQLQKQKKMYGEYKELEKIMDDEEKKLKDFDTMFKAIPTLKENCFDTKFVEQIKKCRDAFSCMKAASRKIKSSRQKVKSFNSKYEEIYKVFKKPQREFEIKIWKMETEFIEIEKESKTHDVTLYELRQIAEQDMIVSA